ncbi:hypothetical protein [Actinomadura bangladeshensis]|uniref:Uncharacterized protein n=1 Tax=Actinomadura bangladeshensis TaxID=453573 RepID=A0A6L9QG81_9ACTN|nr:hypothetical protein [Actinomadura bangladeshensis]NEA24275.1 hypothetical protein [Actinomadura bangladeshensis]
MTDEGAGEAAPAGPEPRQEETGAGQPRTGEPPGRPERPLSGVGKRLSGGGSAPGDTDERLRTEQDARSYFARARLHSDFLISGDQIGGHHYYFSGGTGEHRVRYYRLPPEELAETAEAFVPPAGYAELAGAAGRLPVVVLRGPAGGGKYAVARRLLSEEPGGTLFRLHDETDLGALEAESLERGGRYLLCLDRPAAGGARLSPFDLRRLGAVLSDHGIRLVITATPGVSADQRDFAGCLLDLGAPPDHRDVVRAHLEWRLRGRPGAAERMLADPAVAALLSERLRGGIPLEHAAALARRLAESADSPDGPADAVRRRLSDGEEKEFEEWFEDLPDPAAQCLAIAIAVFGGEPYETVAEAARLLQERLEPPESKDDTERRRSSPFRASQRRRLDAVRARLVESDVSMRHGRAPGKVVRYIDERAPYRVLMLVWRQYDEIRSELVEWLRECARSDTRSMRVRTAVATGVLATESFDYVRSKIIVPWAGSPNDALRFVAAKALQLAAEDPRLTQMVRNLIASWSSEDEDGPELAATAVRAWKVELDAAGPQAVAALFERRAGTGNPGVAVAVAESVAEAFADSKGAYAPELLAMLRRWTGGRDLMRTIVGTLSFLETCVDLVERVPTPSGETVVWPALLRLAVQDGRHQRDIAALWELSFNSAELHEAAAAALDVWARMAERDPVVRGRLARLLVASISRERTERLVRRRAAAWADPRAGAIAPRTARELLSILDEGRSR